MWDVRKRAPAQIGLNWQRFYWRYVKQQCKVGREEENSSSNRPELAAFLLALRDTLIEEPLLYLCDNQSLLKAVTRWTNEGGTATLVGAPDANISSHRDTTEEDYSRDSNLLGQSESVLRRTSE